MEITPDIIKKLLTNLVTPEFPELIHNYGIIVQDYLGMPLAQIVVFCREKTYEKEYEIINKVKSVVKYLGINNPMIYVVDDYKK